MAFTFWSLTARLREPADAPGVADLLHRLLPGGTVLGGSRELASRMEWAGIDVKTADSPVIPFDNRYHVPDFSYVRIEGPAQSLTVALMMLAEMVRQPAWDDAGWRSATDGHNSEKKSDNRGSEKARQLFLGSLLGPDHPLARPVSGPLGETAGNPEKVREVWQGWPGGYFAPDRLVVTVASPLAAQQTLDLVTDAFSGGPDRLPIRGPYPEPMPPEAVPPVEIGEAPQVTLLWGRIADVMPGDRAALLVAMDALSDRMTAVIREREGLAYRLGAGVRPIPGGAWILSTTVGTRPNNAERVAGFLEELVDELSAEPISAGDLERLNARGRRTRMLRGLSAASRAYRVGRALFEGPGSPLAVDDAAFAAVTPEQVHWSFEGTSCRRRCCWWLRRNEDSIPRPSPRPRPRPNGRRLCDHMSEEFTTLSNEFSRYEPGRHRALPERPEACATSAAGATGAGTRRCRGHSRPGWGRTGLSGAEGRAGGRSSGEQVASMVWWTRYLSDPLAGPGRPAGWPR